MTRKRWVVVALLVPLVAACESSPPDQDAPRPTEQESSGVVPGTTETIDLDGRPFRLHVPESYDPVASAPLVVLLHGYTSSAVEQEAYFGLTAESDRHGFLYAAPDGTTDPDGEQFWNATAACCDFHGSGVDDAGYLRRLIDTVVSSYPVDRSRVYVVGHSNGGFMAYRMACDHADVIAAVVSLAGVATSDASQCAPARPVSVLHIHGTNDTAIPYDGGEIAGNAIPSADATVAMWRSLNGCADQADGAAPLDLDSGLPEEETTVTTYAGGCRDATTVELWAIDGGGHVPVLTAGFAPAVVEFLYARAAPS